MLAAFRRFRHSRPFWGGLFAIVGGIEILLLPISPIADLVLLGVAGVSGALIGVVLVILGAFLWFSPPNRTLAGVLTLVFSLASFVVSNLGGLIIGMVLGLIGGGLALAWTPDKAAAKAARGKRRSSGSHGDQDSHGDQSPRDGRGPRDDRDDGPPTAPIVNAVLLIALLPGLVGGLLLAGGGRADAQPLPTPPPVPIPAPVPAPIPGPAPIAAPIPAPPPLPIPGGGVTGPGVVPALPGVPAPLLLPALPVALPPVLFAPLQPTVAPGKEVQVSGLVGELRMDTLTVTNFRYEGMVEYPIVNGGRQRALRIIVDSTDIGNLRINVPGKDSSVQVTQRTGSANARTTRLILECTRVKLKAFGLIPLEFSLDFPPPPLIVIPVLPTTDVDIDYVRLATPTLIVPGLSANRDERPAGKRVGVIGGPSGQDLAVRAPAGRRLTPAQAAQLTQLAARLRQPELLRPYQRQGRL